MKMGMKYLKKRLVYGSRERDIFNQKPTITGWNWGGFAFPLAIGIVVKSPILIVLQFVPLIGQIIGGIIANAEIGKLLNYPYEIVEEYER